MNIETQHTIAKFGGTSMAAPERVLEQLGYEHNDANIKG